MSRFETESSMRGTAYAFEMPPDETPAAEIDVVMAVAAHYESSVVPADVRTAAADQQARRAYANRRGGEAATRVLVRVA